MVGHPVSPSAPIGPQVPPSDWLCRPRTAELEYLSCSRVESLDTTGIVRCCYRAAGRSNRLSARGGNYQPGVQPNDRFPRARSRWEMCGESAPAGKIFGHLDRTEAYRFWPRPLLVSHLTWRHGGSQDYKMRAILMWRQAATRRHKDDSTGKSTGCHRDAPNDRHAACKQLTSCLD